MMEPYHHIIGVDNEKDWEEGRSSLLYVEGINGKKYLLVFTSPEKAHE